MHVCMHVCVHIYCVLFSPHTYVCLHECMYSYVCMYVCIYVYTGRTLLGALGFDESAVDHTYGRPHCRLKAEGFVYKRDVVVYRLGYTTNCQQHLSFHGFMRNGVGPFVSTVTTDDIQLVNPLPLEPFHDLVNVLIWGVSTRRAENGAAALVDV